VLTLLPGNLHRATDLASLLTLECGFCPHFVLVVCAKRHHLPPLGQEGRALIGASVGVSHIMRELMFDIAWTNVKPSSRIVLAAARKP
jgi:hypothetical protein